MEGTKKGLMACQAPLMYTVPQCFGAIGVVMYLMYCDNSIIYIYIYETTCFVFARACDGKRPNYKVNLMNHSMALGCLRGVL